MRIFLLICLVALAICPPPSAKGYNYEELEAKRREREKEINKEVRDCLLKSEISTIFKEKIQENPDENLVKILVENKKSLVKTDKKLYYKCRKERHLKYMEQFKTKKYYKLLNESLAPRKSIKPIESNEEDNE